MTCGSVLPTELLTDVPMKKSSQVVRLYFQVHVIGTKDYCHNLSFISHSPLVSQTVVLFLLLFFIIFRRFSIFLFYNKSEDQNWPLLGEMILQSAIVDQVTLV